ncbi:MAG: PEGA domain-containing protein [Bacteroidales bacterium]|nr:PEGA domain-containing protein [Bacteroidales bacterium]
MKKIIIAIIAIFLTLNALAQLEVKPGSFKETIGFVNTNPDPDYQYDDNDLPFAVIKVRTENISDKQRRELIFEGNGGTFIMLEYKIGEVWVYLTARYADYLKISHPEFSSYEFTLPEDLKAKHGYEMTLVNKTSKVSDGWGSLKITTTPEDAKISLNGTEMSNPYSNDMIQAGGYEIIVSKDRYKTTSEFVEVKKGEHREVNIVLKSDVAEITFKAEKDTEIYLNDKFLWLGTWTGKVSSGNYKVEYRQPYHRPVTELITVVAEEPATYELHPIPIYAKISITSEPSEADVYIDNKHVGVTPLSLTDIMIGPREVKIKKEKWKTIKEHFDVKEVDIIILHEVMINCPEGAVNGIFSVSDSTKVYFSQGNLQYQASTNTWRFAENPWDFIDKESNKKRSETYDGWIDQFGWGTSGWDSGAWCYQPYSKVPNEFCTNYGEVIGSENQAGLCFTPGGNDYAYNRATIISYAKAINKRELTGKYARADWGVYNAIENGGNKPNIWRTLSKDEWVYVFNKRNTKSGIRYARAVVNGFAGVILLPDNWDAKTYKLSGANKEDAKSTSNKISSNDWKDKFEANGAVFLPLTNICYYCKHKTMYAYYWSVSVARTWSDDCYWAHALGIHDDNIKADDDMYKFKPHSVRLVSDVEQ